MRLHFIVCKVLQREAYYCASLSKNVVDITLMPQGLHNTPDILKKEPAKQSQNNKRYPGQTL